MNKLELQSDEPVFFEKTDSNYEEKYCIISFISPTENIHKKLIHDITKFAYKELNEKVYEIGRSLIQQLNISINLNYESYLEMNPDLTDEEKDFLLNINKDLLNNEKSQSELYFKKYMITNETLGKLLSTIDFKDLEDKNNIYGIKINGVFSNTEEADKCIDNNKKLFPYIHSYVVAVGEWLLWDPQSDMFENQIFNSDSIAIEDDNIDLNKLISNYNFNAEQSRSLQDQVSNEKISSSHVNIVDIIDKRAKLEDNKQLKNKLSKLNEKRNLKKK